MMSGSGNKDTREDREVSIKEFPLHTMAPNSKIVVIGKPGTGKSSLIADIVYTFKHIFPVAQISSGTEDSNGYYRKIFPSTFVFNELNEEVLINWIKRQKLAKKYLTNPWSIQILDDTT